MKKKKKKEKKEKKKEEKKKKKKKKKKTKTNHRLHLTISVTTSMTLKKADRTTILTTLRMASTKRRLLALLRQHLLSSRCSFHL